MAETLKRFTTRLESNVYDTLYRMKYETMLDASKIVNKATKQFLIENCFDIRPNTDEENEMIFGKKSDK